MDQFLGDLTFLAPPAAVSGGGGSGTDDPLVPSDGTQNLTGNLAVSGNGTFGGTLGVTGATSLAATTVSTTLGVTGAATLSSTLGVTGATTLTSATLSTTLGVTGAATLSSTLAVTGAVTLSSTLAAGITTLATDAASTNTVLRPLIVRRTTSSTAAASLGAGLSFEAEDASGNVDEAASLDSFWTTATDGASQQSVLSGRVRVADTMTELFRIGGGTTASALDTNAFLSIGRCLIDSRSSDVAYFSHRDNSTTGNYALNQAATGATVINAASGQPVTFAIAGTGMGRVNGTGWGFFTATTSPVAQQTSGANLTNNVTSGGTDDTITNWTDLSTYATDAAAIRNAVYQLARKLKQVNDGLRAYGLLT